MEFVVIEKPEPHIGMVKLNREKKLNAMSFQVFREIRTAISSLSSDDEIRVIILAGAGKCFTAGLDLSEAADLSGQADDRDSARKAIKAYDLIRELQDCMSSVEKCSKPVIAVIHGYCIGAGVDLTSACDIRYAAEDAVFSIREIDIGMAADVGTLQRFPKIVDSDSWVRELVYTGRNFQAKEALAHGFVSKVFPNYQETLQNAMELAKVIASKSPVAIVGCKRNLVYSRDHTVDEGLDYIARWNSWALLCPDLVTTFMAKMNKEKPVYPKL